MVALASTQFSTPFWEIVPSGPTSPCAVVGSCFVISPCGVPSCVALPWWTVQGAPLSS